MIVMVGRLRVGGEMKDIFHSRTLALLLQDSTCSKGLYPHAKY